jgi:chromosome segregation ATPase
MFSIRGDNGMSDPTVQPSGGSGLASKVLFALVVVLLAATAYLFQQINQTRAEIAQIHDSLLEEISRIHETNAVTSQTSRRTVESLKAELDSARAQASQLAGQARLEAEKHAEELASRLEQQQQQQAQRVAAVSNEVSTVKEATNAVNSRVSEVNADVGTVKTDVANTRAELEKTIATLKAAQGDLGVQSGLIATNAKELSALRALGERNYTEFKLGKSKAPQRVGDIAVLLKKTDPKKNKYTIDVIADDKRVEKKDRGVNEPVQFIVSRARQPYELIVNEVRKDLIIGYLAAPKVQNPRN